MVWVFRLAALVAMIGSGSALAADGLFLSVGDKKIPIDSSRLKKRLEVSDAAGVDAVEMPALMKAYKQNEIAADNQFKGKWLMTRGVVGDIQKGTFGGVTITFKLDGYGFETVRADLFPEQVCQFTEAGVKSCQADAKAATFKVGQRLDAECKGGGVILKTPMLRDCLVFSK